MGEIGITIKLFYFSKMQFGLDPQHMINWKKLLSTLSNFAKGFVLSFHPLGLLQTVSDSFFYNSGHRLILKYLQIFKESIRFSAQQLSKLKTIIRNQGKPGNSSSQFFLLSITWSFLFWIKKAFFIQIPFDTS